MQLVIHAGAHFSEEERLMKCLLRNKEALQARGVSVPGPGRYRKLLRRALGAMADGTLADIAQEVLVDAILDGENPDRVLLSNAHFFGAPRAALRKGLLYPNAPIRLQHLMQLFPDHKLELFMAIRNPATFLPLCFEKSPRETMADFMDGVDPRALRWTDTFLRIREAVPQVPITVWCNEDAPLVWAQVVREISGLEHGDHVIGSFDLLADIMSREGMARFVSYLKGKPEMTEIQLRRVMVAFLDKFAIDDAIEEEIDLPGWTEALVSELTGIYDEDVLEVARIPGVELISP